MIRRFRLGDQKAIALLEKECFSKPWSEDSVLESANFGVLFWLFEEDDKILGYIGLQTVLDEGQITNIAVANAARGRGIGSSLMKTLIDYSKQNGIVCVSLEVRESNEAAQGLYQKIGFKAVGKRKRFYTNPIEDAIIKIKEIN